MHTVWWRHAFLFSFKVLVTIEIALKKKSKGENPSLSCHLIDYEDYSVNTATHNRLKGILFLHSTFFDSVTLSNDQSIPPKRINNNCI